MHELHLLPTTFLLPLHIITLMVNCGAVVWVIIVDANSVEAIDKDSFKIIMKTIAEASNYQKT